MFLIPTPWSSAGIIKIHIVCKTAFGISLAKKICPRLIHRGSRNPYGSIIGVVAVINPLILKKIHHLLGFLLVQPCKQGAVILIFPRFSAK